MAWKGGIVLAVLGLLLFFWDVLEEFLFELEVYVFESEHSILTIILRLLVWTGMFAMVWRAWLAWRYRPAAPVSDELLPTCTVVVPAYNEGAQVLKSLLSLAASDYPAQKLQIVAVDDGSRDDTWQWMQTAAERLGQRLELVRLAANSGKRRALWEGFQKANGEILVTMDSDSEVTPQTLRHLVSPFVRDAAVGAVAGNVRVLNREQGLIPRMLDVSFTFSFDFMRAGQSVINTVLTTPGALSAYRGAVARPLLPQWLGQRFLGRPANIGEDRALTNLILKSGYHAHFAREALVLTEVPVKYRPLCRMFLRWARSNVRETIVMGGFVFRRFRRAPASGARLNYLLHLARMTLGELGKFSTAAMLLSAPFVVATGMAGGVAIGGMILGLFYILRHRSMDFLWAFPYCLFWVTALSWISLYALCTPHKTGWLTRGLGQAAPIRPAQGGAGAL